MGQSQFVRSELQEALPSVWMHFQGIDETGDQTDEFGQYSITRVFAIPFIEMWAVYIHTNGPIGDRYSSAFVASYDAACAFAEAVLRDELGEFDVVEATE
jgi:hypothetical protein